jgi:putative FmdB family regulatory protein
MPTYDYECSKCGHTFDAFQNMSDDPLKKCPQCSRMGLKRLIGGGLGVIFKGSGFYSTDSRSASKATTSPASTGESKADNGSSATASKGGESTGSKSDGASKSGASDGTSGSAKKSSEKVAG